MSYPLHADELEFLEGKDFEQLSWLLPVYCEPTIEHPVTPLFLEKKK